MIQAYRSAWRRRQFERIGGWLAAIATAALWTTANAEVPDLPGPDTYPTGARTVERRHEDQAVQVTTLKTVITASGQEAVADRLIVMFREGSSEADRDEAHAHAGRHGAGHARPVLKVGGRAVLVDVTGADNLESAARAYASHTSVAGASPDWVMHAHDTPNDPQEGNQWGLATARLPEAWNRTHGSSSTLIAILDTGIFEGHRDLSGKVVDRVDFSGSQFGTADIAGHGTHVAGIAAATTNNGTDVAGVGRDSRLLNVKVLDDMGSGTVSALTNGIRWAADHGASVINMSLGGGTNCTPSFFESLFDVGLAALQDAINYAHSLGVTQVASAGNSGTAVPQWPAVCPNVISVANTRSDDMLGPNSTFGPWVTIAAPGTAIVSTSVPSAANCSQGDFFGQCTGTSMAAPFVSGVAALVRASCGVPSADVVMQRLVSGADIIAGTGPLFFAGRVNALNSVCFPVPGNLRVAAVTTSSIQVAWVDTTPGETRFEVQETLPGGITSLVALPPGSTSFTVSGLAAGTRIGFQVRSCDGLGCSAFSNAVQATAGFRLSVAASGGGTVVSTPAGITCGFGGTACTQFVAPGATITLTAKGRSIPGKPPTPIFFDHWEGACAGFLGAVCTLNVNGDTSATAFFTQ